MGWAGQGSSASLASWAGATYFKVVSLCVRWLLLAVGWPSPLIPPSRGGTPVLRPWAAAAFQSSWSGAAGTLEAEAWCAKRHCASFSWSEHITRLPQTRGQGDQFSSLLEGMVK